MEMRTDDRFFFDPALGNGTGKSEKKTIFSWKTDDSLVKNDGCCTKTIIFSTQYYSSTLHTKA